MEANPKVIQLYNAYLKKLGWQDKLELAELLMQSTLELVRQKETAPNTTTSPSYTAMQKKLLQVPVMKEEDYNVFLEKKKDFEQWK
jgi:hypothetical protein